MEIVMCFPVFKKTGSSYSLAGVFLDLNKAQAKCQELGEDYHWEPWPLDCLFEEGFTLFR